MSGIGKTLIVSGAESLFRVAVNEYSDPLDFIAIMQANDLESPFLVQPQSVVIPKNPSNTGGEPTQPPGKGVGIIQPVISYPYEVEVVNNVTLEFFSQGEVYSNTKNRGKIQSSIDGTLITVGLNGTLTDSANNKWTITNPQTITIAATATNPASSTALVGKVAFNGLIDNSTSNVIAMTFVRGVIYYQDVNLFWYSKAWITPVLQDGPYTYPQFNDVARTNGITYFLDRDDDWYKKTILANSWSDGLLDSPLLTAFLPVVVIPSTTLPGAVFPLTSNVTQTGLTVFWTAPTGSQPIYYQVQYRLSGSSTWLNVGSSTMATDLQIVNLTPNTIYQLQVLTSNGLGSSLEAPLILTFQTAFGATAPGAVTPIISSVAAQAIVVSWNAPTGTAPFTYEVFYRVTDTINFASTANISLLAEGITGLQSNTSYDFKVLASNSIGSGPFSSIVTATTTSIPVGSVGTPTFTNIQQTSVTISWNIPLGTPPFTYLLQDRFTGTTAWTTLITTSANTFNVTNLIDQQSYDFQIIPSDLTVTSTVPPTIVSIIVQALLVANVSAISSSTANLTTVPKIVATMSANALTTSTVTGALINRIQLASNAIAGATVGNNSIPIQGRDGNLISSSDGNQLAANVTRGFGNPIQSRDGNLINSSDGNQLYDVAFASVPLTTSPKGSLTVNLVAIAGATATLTNHIALAANVLAQSLVASSITVTVLVQSPQGFTVSTVGPAVIDATLESFRITSGGQVAVNGVDDITTSSVILLLMWNNLIYYENSGGTWFSKAISTGSWNGPTTDPRLIVSTRRNFAQNPGQDGSFWVQPFQNTATFTTTGPTITLLRNGTFGSPTGNINLKGNYSVPWVIGTSSDPEVTVTDGTKSINVRIPLGTIIETPSSAFDQSIGGSDETQPYLIWSISGATMNTGSVQASGSVITGTYGMQIDDGSGLIMCDAVTNQPGTNNSIGGIQDYELSLANADPNYVIQHMLAFQMDPTQASSAGPIWPLKVIDGGAVFTGSIPQGITIGIPSTTIRPTGQTRGFYLLWDNLQQFGWFNYNFGSAGCTFITCYSNLSGNAALVTDLHNSISAIMAYVGILNNQTGLSTLKGKIGNSVNAYPAPPLLDYTPTGGVPVLPSSFQAWYPSGYNVKSVPPVTVNSGPPSQAVIAGFTDLVFIDDFTTNTIAPSQNAIGPASNNLLPNSSNVGAVIGTPGTLPVNWSYYGVTNINSLTPQIVAFGTSGGLPYIDINFTGTVVAATGSNIYFIGSIMPVTNSTPYVLSAYLQVIAGSTSNISSCTLSVDWSSPSGYLSTMTGSAIPTSTLTLRSVTGTSPSTATLADSYLQINWSASTSVNLTIRFSGIQFEQASTRGVNSSTPSIIQGYNWYWSYDVTTATDWSLHTTATAASISNGNVGAGNNASTAGGILTIAPTEAGAVNSALITVPGGFYNSNPGYYLTTPPTAGSWNHGYFEAYIQTNINNNGGTTVQADGWPAFWAWTTAALHEFGFGSSSISIPNGSAEIDILETYGTIFGATPGQFSSTLHNWGATQVGYAGFPTNITTIDNNWHTYGCLWTSTGLNTGQVSFYLDNQLLVFGSEGPFIATGAGATNGQVNLDQNGGVFLILSSGLNWPMNVDWVKVWQSGSGSIITNGIYVLDAVVPSAIAAAPVGVKVVEATSDGSGAFWSSANVTAMKSGGGIVLGYLDCGFCESYRPYYSTALSAGIIINPGTPVFGSGASAEYSVEFWTSTWLTICENWISNLIAVGFDGVYLDVIDGWNYSDSPSDPVVIAAGGLTASANNMTTFIQNLRNFAHTTTPNFKIWVNGGEELFAYSPPAYVNSFDGMLKEQVCYADSTHVNNTASRNAEHSLLVNATNAGKPVILIEYVTGSTEVNDVKNQCATWGFGYYIANPNQNLSGVDSEGF